MCYYHILLLLLSTIICLIMYLRFACVCFTSNCSLHIFQLWGGCVFRIIIYIYYIILYYIIYILYIYYIYIIFIFIYR